jgi:hypothetical protein
MARSAALGDAGGRGGASGVKPARLCFQFPAINANMPNETPRAPTSIARSDSFSMRHLPGTTLALSRDGRQMLFRARKGRDWQRQMEAMAKHGSEFYRMLISIRRDLEMTAKRALRQA